MQPNTPRGYEPTANDRQAPTNDRPLSSEPTDKYGRSVFYETHERAIHAGQWLIAKATINTEDCR